MDLVLRTFSEGIKPTLTAAYVGVSEESMVLDITPGLLKSSQDT